MLRNTDKIQGNGELETLVQKKHFHFISKDKIFANSCGNHLFLMKF